VGRNPVDRATPEAVQAPFAARRLAPDIPRYIDYAAIAPVVALTLVACMRGERNVDDVIAALEDLQPSRSGWRDFRRTQWRIVGAEPAPRLLTVNIDEGSPGTFKDR